MRMVAEYELVHLMMSDDAMRLPAIAADDFRTPELDTLHFTVSGAAIFMPRRTLTLECGGGK